MICRICDNDFDSWMNKGICTRCGQEYRIDDAEELIVSPHQLELLRADWRERQPQVHLVAGDTWKAHGYRYILVMGQKSGDWCLITNGQVDCEHDACGMKAKLAGPQWERVGRETATTETESTPIPPWVRSVINENLKKN